MGTARRGAPVRPRLHEVLILCWTAVAALALVLESGCTQVPAASAPSPRARWQNNQGVVYMDQHNYTRARDEFRQALDLDPTYARAYANLGIAYYSLGQYDSALVVLETALRYDPGQLHAHYTLGLIYHAQGREYEKARQAFARVVQADPDDPMSHYFLGRVEAKLGHGQEAIEEFRQAIRLDPHHVSAHYALAQQLKQENRREEWQQVLATFNQLNQQGYEGVSSSYQGQGKYAEAEGDLEEFDPAQGQAPVPLRFTGPLPPPPGFPSRISFATFLDADQDGDPDLVLGDRKPRLYRNDGGTFVPAARPDFSLPRPFAIRDAVFGDLDQDGDPDLVLSGEETFLLLQGAAGHLRPGTRLGGPARGAVLADVDHDGDLDVFVLGQKENRLLANDGTGRFSDITRPAGLAGAPPGRRGLFSDFDNDRDVDLFLLSPGGLQLFSNNRDGTFSDLAPALGLAAVDAMDAAVEDFDQDGYMDLCTAGADGTLTLYRNQRGKGFRPTALTAVPDQVRGLQPADFDADGDLDLLVWGERGLHLYRWQAGQFQLEPEVLTPRAAPRQVLVEDLDADGTADVWADGQWWRNDTAGGHWLEVSLQGLTSNRDGIGAKVEVQTPYRRQKQERRGDSRSSGVLRFGLGQADSVDFVRILWPSGVRQNELATAAGQRLRLAEINRKGTSCPILYAWDGQGYRFVTDILGGAIIGYLTAPGQYYQADTDEYVRLGPIAPRDGRYVLQIADQLEEVIYLDAVHLLAVDHPDSVEVYPDERLLAAPPYPGFHLYALRHLRPLPRVSDQQGADLSAQVRAIDDEWAAPFAEQDIHGYATEYSLRLDLGDLGRDAHPVLLAYGWVDYAHASSNWAASQRGLELRPPRLEVPDGRGGWTVARPDMGCPAGLPKHMLCDLQGLLAAGDHCLRITGNTPVYWDQFQVGDAADVPLQVHRLTPARGDLHWRGYPAHTAVRETFAFRYDYERLQTEADWGTHAGAFTRFGEVGELLGQADDCYVIMGHGDELTVEFDAAALPPLPAGQRRTFLLYADGFGKDMDPHSAHALTVGPLPFHGMSAYPYPAGQAYPQDERHLGYLLDYNTRLLRGYYE